MVPPEPALHANLLPEATNGQETEARGRPAIASWYAFGMPFVGSGMQVRVRPGAGQRSRNKPRAYHPLCSTIQGLWMVGIGLLGSQAKQEAKASAAKGRFLTIRQKSGSGE